MLYTKLSKDWNADPNVPEVTIFLDGDNIVVQFYLNSYLFENFDEEDKAKLTFFNVYRYLFNSMNDEGYFSGQYHYKQNELPWGEFYEVSGSNQIKWENNELLSFPHLKDLRHFVFFFKDNTFECLAENYQIEFIKEHTE